MITLQFTTVDELDEFLQLVSPDTQVILTQLGWLTQSLADSTQALQAAVSAYAPDLISKLTKTEAMMANPVLDDLRNQIEQTKTVERSAVTLINGIGDRITAAVQKALANGATAEELAPITDEVAALKGDTDSLAAAVEANTPNVAASGGHGPAKGPHKK